MKHVYVSALLLLVPLMSFGQNRINFRHRLTQSRIDGADFTLNYYDTSNPADKKYRSIRIPDGATRSCIIKLDSKGNILVDFWRLIPDSDSNKGQDAFVNSDTPINVDFPIKLTDGRTKIGEPTKVLFVPFRALGFGIATIPARIRFKEEISPTEKSETTVTSPRPDIALTVGLTRGGSIITNRAITNVSATLGAFGGISGAEIKNGVVKAGTPLYGTSKSQTNVALSYGVSLTLARNNLGLVLAYGFDKSLGEYSSDWIYQKEGWFGIGISAGLGIF